MFKRIAEPETFVRGRLVVRAEGGRQKGSAAWPSSVACSHLQLATLWRWGKSGSRAGLRRPHSSGNRLWKRRGDGED